MPLVTTPGYCSPQPPQMGVEAQLLTYGYTPLERVIVDLGGGQQQGVFIKALDPIGILVYVHLDDGGHISVDPRDLTVVERGTFESIPYSLKESSYKEVAPYARGIAIECDKGICVIHHDESKPGTLSQINYEYNKTTTEPKATLTLDPTQETHRKATLALQHRDKVMADDSLNVLPVISLQDIKANPLIVLRHTEIANARIAELAHLSCIQDLESFNQAYMEMTMAAKQFFAGYYNTRSIVTGTTNQYRNRAKQHISRPPTDPAGRSDYAATMYNLRAREEFNHELVRCCRTLAGLGQQVRSVTRDIASLTTHCIGDSRKFMGAITPQ